jgi:L-seryl-tRNA(Ser) seleniumtransferase
LNFPHLSDTELERRLRSADPPVIVRIDQGKVVLDLRTVFPEEEETLLRILEM